MITDYFRILSPFFKPGRLKGIDPLIRSLMILGGVTKKAEYYAGISVERERERTMKGLVSLGRLRKNENHDFYRWFKPVWGLSNPLF